MAATDLGSYTTLLELKNAHAPDGNMAKIIDILWKRNSILRDAAWVEANDLTSHVFGQTVSEPSGSFGVINRGVAYEDGVTKQVREPIGMLESYARIDERLLKKARNKEQFRSQRNALAIKGLDKTFHSKFLYGSLATEPEGVDGVGTRIDSTTDWPNSTKLAGGSGSDTTSIWVVKWGEEGVFLTYPRGDKAQTMIEEEDLGRQLIHDTTGAYTAWVTHFMINFGICIADPKAIQRIANVETTGTTNIFDEDHLIEVMNRMPDTENAVIYVNETIKTQMDIALKDKTNVNFTIDEAWGRKGVLHFKGVPVRMVDAILNTETAIS